MADPYEVRADLIQVDAESSLDALSLKREELVGRVLASIPPQHRRDWEEALDPESTTVIYAVDHSETLAQMIAEVYAIDAEVARRSARHD